VGERFDRFGDLQITQALEYAAAATNVHFYRLKEPA
jgi:hypothetical protein